MRIPKLLLVSLSLLYKGNILAQTHDQAFSSDGVKTINSASDQPNFTLALHPNAEISKDHNVLWCDTMQLAWNEAIDMVGEKLNLLNAPPEVAWFNNEEYTKADLDNSSYVAIADFERNQVEEKIREALQEKFGGEASPKLIPAAPRSPGPDDFMAYAYLFKRLSFFTKFTKNTLSFQGSTEVKSFGFSTTEDATAARLQEVSLLSYKSDDDFVIQLKTKMQNDQLFLAKVTPGTTLKATIQAVMDRLQNPDPKALDNGDQLAVPQMNFDVTSHFPQLEGLVLSPSADAKVDKLVISSVIQNIRFQLNEEGVKLKSEAIAVFTLGLPEETPPPPKPHLLIFDKPYLIVMKQWNGEPYFAMWVGNSDFLVPAQ